MWLKWFEESSKNDIPAEDENDFEEVYHTAEASETIDAVEPTESSNATNPPYYVYTGKDRLTQ